MVAVKITKDDLRALTKCGMLTFAVIPYAENLLN